MSLFKPAFCLLTHSLCWRSDLTPDHVHNGEKSHTCARLCVRVWCLLQQWQHGVQTHLQGIHHWPRPPRAAGELSGTRERREPVCHSCSRTGTSHSTELLIYGKQAFFLRAMFRSVSLNPGHKNITRLFYSSKSTDHSIKQSAAVAKDDKHSAACCASIFS